MADRRWFAYFVLFLLPLGGLAGCGTSSRDPAVKLDATRVAEMRDKARKGKGGGETKKVAGEGWGHLTGTIRLTGKPPARPGPKITADPGYCGKFDLEDETLKVGGAENGLANAVIYLRDNTSVHESYAATAEKPVILDNHGCRFVPHVSWLRTTQSLQVKNTDTVLHNTRVGPHNPSLPAGSPGILLTFDEMRTPMKVSCSIHDWMGGWVLAKEHPYIAVTDENGNFKIQYIPAGVELNFQVWHERAQGGLTGTSEGATVDSQGRFKITVPKEGEAKFNLTVPLEAVQ